MNTVTCGLLASTDLWEPINDLCHAMSIYLCGLGAWGHHMYGVGFVPASSTMPGHASALVSSLLSGPLHRPLLTRNDM